MAQTESNALPKLSSRAGALRGQRLLKYAAILYLAAFLMHNGDHLRRGLGTVSPEVTWAGNVAALLSIVAITLALAGHRLAPAIAVAVGFSVALGVTAVHLAPPWGAFSDSLQGSGADALTWAAVLAEIAGAAVLGVAGVYALRRQRAAAA